MGMTRASLDLQLQQGTQRAIAELENKQKALFQALQIIDANTRQAFSVLMNDLNAMNTRLKFILDEIKLKMNEDEIKQLEERFKEFNEKEQAKLQEDIANARKEYEKKIAEANKAASDNVVQ